MLNGNKCLTSYVVLTTEKKIFSTIKMPDISIALKYHDRKLILKTSNVSKFRYSFHTNSVWKKIFIFSYAAYFLSKSVQCFEVNKLAINVNI